MIKAITIKIKEETYNKVAELALQAKTAISPFSSSLFEDLILKGNVNKPIVNTSETTPIKVENPNLQQEIDLLKREKELIVKYVTANSLISRRNIENYLSKHLNSN